MVKVIQDNYTLGESSGDKYMANGGTAIRVDVVLGSKITPTIGVSIEGVVYDTSSPAKPIQGALVGITDSSFNPISYTITNSSGKYLFNLPLTDGSYKVFASAKYKKLSPAQNVTLIKGQNNVLPNIILEDDPSSTLGIIAGEVTDVDKKSLFGAVVSLYNTDVTPPVLSAVTYSNEYGVYAFRDVKNGKYSIKFSFLGYIAKSFDNISISGTAGIISSSAALTKDINAANGTISGMITNTSTNTPIDRGDVILYRVETNGSLTAVAYTKTNAQGVYLFVNVPEGSYKVLSNEAQTVDVRGPIADGPYIDNITIARRGLAKQLKTSFAYGTLTSGAYVDTTTPLYVRNIGGTSGGVAKLTMDNMNDGTYDLYVIYAAPGVSMKFGVYLDDKKVGVCTTGTVSDTTFITPIRFSAGTFPLTAGSHTITIMGEAGGPVPWIGDGWFSEVRKSFSLVNQQLLGGATVDATTGYVTGIGGATDGSRTFTFANVDTLKNAGKYTMSIKYLAGDANKPLRVTINGGTPTDYTVTKTASNAASDAGTQSIVVDLPVGTNTIKFHGNGKDAGPMLGTVSLLYANNDTVIEAESTTLSGSAIVNNGFVQNMGTTGDGAITMNYNANIDAYYDCIVKYVAPDNNRKMVFVVNGVAGDYVTVTATAGVLPANAVDKTVPLYLKAGANTIKIQG